MFFVGNNKCGNCPYQPPPPPHPQIKGYVNQTHWVYGTEEWIKFLSAFVYMKILFLKLKIEINMNRDIVSFNTLK